VFTAIPRDSLWQTCLSFLSDVCAFLEDRQRARELYQLMLPYEPLTVVVGNSVACNGAASRSLGQLAAVMEKWDLAERHFQHAIELNTNIKALPWLARTRHQYARMLSARGGQGDAEEAQNQLTHALAMARLLDMRGLVEKIEAAGDDFADD
jgi:tetratricopeptide (TPR) repeat protein